MVFYLGVVAALGFVALGIGIFIYSRYAAAFILYFYIQGVPKPNSIADYVAKMWGLIFALVGAFVGYASLMAS